MIAQYSEPLPIDSDLTPFSFSWAYACVGDLSWRHPPHDWDAFKRQHLVVSKHEDLRVVRVIMDMVATMSRELPVTFADIPEFSWILFAADGRLAVYSCGA